jgi:NADPH:quinone reductase-like Zn-dependent oxidoreductase
MTFEEAAAVPDGVILALSYLSRADLPKRRKILIYGASGSIGTAGVQLAKYFDADSLRYPTRSTSSSSHRSEPIEP